MRNLLINLLLKLLLKESPVRGTLQDEQYIAAMSKMYQNPAMEQYLNQREVYLIYRSTELLLKGQIDHARGMAGQLTELRSMRNRMKVCYLRKNKK